MPSETTIKKSAAKGGIYFTIKITFSPMALVTLAASFVPHFACLLHQAILRSFLFSFSSEPV
jgi:hypothetical protein